LLILLGTPTKVEYGDCKHIPCRGLFFEGQSERKDTMKRFFGNTSIRNALRVCLGLVVISMLTSCLSLGPTLEAKMDSWVGRDLDELYTVWGPPARTQNLSGGGEVISYSEQNQDPDVGTMRATVTFTVRDNVIRSWRMSGNTMTLYQLVVGSSAYRGR
jgi:hypothetical protein